MFGLSGTDIVTLGRALGAAGSILLLLNLGLLAVGVLEFGRSVRRMQATWEAALEREKQYGAQMKAERDEALNEVRVSQTATAQALAVAQSQLEQRRERYR